MSRLYDHTLGRWVLTHADDVVAVSEACEHFVRSTFGVKDVRTVYRGINPTQTSVTPDDSIIHIGYVGRLVDLK